MSDAPQRSTLPREVDVIVVGSGAGALTGAYTAAMSGLSVLVLEKTRYVGGTSAYSGAGLWLPGNAALARGGMQDSVEDGLTYFTATVGDRTPRELHAAYVRTGPELMAFLESSPHFAFDFHPFPDYFDAPGRGLPKGRAVRPAPLSAEELGDLRSLVRPPTAIDKFATTSGLDQFGRPTLDDPLTGGTALIGRLLLALHGTGAATVRTESRVRSLVVEGDRVIGVRVDPDDSVVRASKGVLVAAGGFECDPVRRREYQGLPGADWSAAPPGSNTGDALTMLEDVGAAVDLLDESWWCASVLFPNGLAGFAPIVQGGIFVDPAGRRFVNESLPYDRLGHELRSAMETWGPDAHFWWVFDSATPSIPGTTVPMPDEQAFRDAGIWRSGRTVEELAQGIDVPADALRDTITRFNGFVDRGLDEDFRRGDDDYDRFFGVGTGPNSALVPLALQDLSAVRIVLGDLGTKGGARIDGDGRVLRADGSAITGLFAAGGSAASVAGHVYPGPGVPLGLGMVFGYRAAHAMRGDG